MTATEYRVTGPPGTGKTQWITTQVERWSSEYDPEEFALCSLTRASAAVLAGRVPVPSANTTTLHAAAYRALGTPPIAEVGTLRAAWNDQTETASWKIGGSRSEDDLETGTQERETAGGDA